MYTAFYVWSSSAAKSLLEFSLELQLQEYGSFTLVGLFIFENTYLVSKVNYFWKDWITADVWMYHYEL